MVKERLLAGVALLWAWPGLAAPLTAADALYESVFHAVPLPPARQMANAPPEFHAYRQRWTHFRLRLPSAAGSGFPASALLEKRRSIERAIVALLGTPGIEAAAHEFARDVKLHYEWEGLREAPLAEAESALEYLRRAPTTPLRPFLHLFAAHRLRAAGECPAGAAMAPAREDVLRDYRRQLDLALGAGIPLLRLAAQALERRPFVYLNSAAAAPAPMRLVFRGEVKAGDRFERRFGTGFRFLLAPTPHGWLIEVREDGRDEDLARLTPPFHFVPNPREIEGWHFRNSDNTGPNEAGPKNVNAPGAEREFIFSPEVGRGITGPRAASQDVDRIRDFGHGRLRIIEYRLTEPKPAARAAFSWLRFEAEVSWRGPAQ